VRWGGALVAVAALVATVVLVSCQPARRVLVIGDSLTVGAVQQGLGEGSTWEWTVSAEVGRGTNAGVAVARSFDAEAFDLVIVALGTNDYLDPKATYRARIDAMVAALDGAPAIAWVNVDTGTSHLAPAAVGVNAALAEAPGRHRHLRLGDWAAHVRTVPDMATHRAGDGIHYSASGKALFARWLEGLVPA
jgi:lysophospholipase L1-like esterase